MINKLRELYWFRLRTKCPFCHKPLIPEGYPKDFFWQNYRCDHCKKFGWE